MDSGRSREPWVTAMVVVSVVLAIVALALSYAGRALLRSQPFADRAVAALRQPAVSDEVADRLADAVVGSGSGDLATVRPLVRAATGSIVSSPAFLALLRRAVLEAHVAVVQRHDHAMAINVADAGVLVAGLLRRFAPGRGADGERRARRAPAHAGARRRRAVGGADRPARLRARVGPGGDRVAARRRRDLAIARAPAHRPPARGRARARRPGAGGAVHDRRRGRRPAGAVGTRSRSSPPSGRRSSAGCGCRRCGRPPPARSSRRWRRSRWGRRRSPSSRGRAGAGSPASDGGAVTRTGLAAAVALIAAGIAILLEPGAVLRVAVLAVGALLLYRGVEGVLRWGMRQVRARSRLDAGARVAGRPALRLVPVVLGVAALGAVATVIVTGGGDEAPAATPTTCNGFAALCGRPLNDVAFAATHNSMASVTIPTFLFGQQDGTIADQLDFGIRGLLIDTYYGDKVDGGVRTDLESLPKRAAAERELGAPAVDAALRIRSRLERRGTGTPGHLPVPRLLRDRRGVAVLGADRPALVPGRAPGRGGGRDQPGRGRVARQHPRAHSSGPGCWTSSIAGRWVRSRRCAR